MVTAFPKTDVLPPLPQNVLITGINYWPEPTGNAPYTTGLAEHLLAKGCSVTVLTGMPYYPQWQIYDGYQGKLRHREAVQGVAVERFRQYIPATQSALKRAIFEGTFLLNALPALGGRRPDLVIGVVPSLSGGVLAALAARKYKAPMGLLYQDLVGQGAIQSGIPGGGRVGRLTSRIEGWVARRASGIAIVAEGFRRYFEELGVDPARIHRVRNWTHIGAATRSRQDTRAGLGIADETPVCLHAGNMGYKQGLENVIECARMARDRFPDLQFVFVGDGNQRAHLQALAAGLGNIRFIPPQSEEDFPNILAAADVLLVNQRETVTDMALPGKLTSYLAAGRPVVAAVSPNSETAIELASAEAGLVVDAGDPEALLGAINRLISDRQLADEMGERGRAYALETFTAAKALDRLEEFIRATVKSSQAVGR
jgi:glycosyltransferase involved in cell wall biosynthesis